MSSASDPSSYHGALYKYWDGRRIAGSIPMRSNIEPLDIVRVLPFVGLAERRDDGYFWRLIGTAIVEHFGKDHTGEPYGAHFWPPDFVAATTATFDEALEREAPFFDEFVYRSPTGTSHAVSRLVCPLKGDGARSPPMVIQTRNPPLRWRCRATSQPSRQGLGRVSRSSTDCVARRTRNRGERMVGESRDLNAIGRIAAHMGMFAVKGQV